MKKTELENEDASEWRDTLDKAEWQLDEDRVLNLCVKDQDGQDVHCFLQLRPSHCDRGHIQLNINGHLGLDDADSFPRYFFNFNEADWHTRAFLAWRIWKERQIYDLSMFQTGGRG